MTQYFLTDFSILLILNCSQVLCSDLKYYFLQVLASRTKIYIILEFITGGELFDKIVSSSRWINAFLLSFYHYFYQYFSWS